MSFASETGYIPVSVKDLMNVVRINVNEQFNTSYTEETFLGTNFYKYFYSLVQHLQLNEIKTSEIFARLQEYFNVTNEKVLRPNTTGPGIFDYFQSKGFFVSIKPPTNDDAGKVFICIDVDSTDDNYEETKKELCGYVKDCVVAGVVSQGTEATAITLSNNQSFDFKYSLPNPIPVLLKLTLTLSGNNSFSILGPDEIKELLMANIAARYKLGMDFEPQRYFSIVDAPWASTVLLEWSDDDGENWHSTVYDADFDEIFTYDSNDISIVEV